MSFIASPSIMKKDLRYRLSHLMIKNPLSTYAFRFDAEGGGQRIMIVDRELDPTDGDIVLIENEGTFRFASFVQSMSLDTIWGTVTWMAESARLNDA